MLELMEQRRSCRNFTAQSVEPEKQALLLRAAQLAPSGRNIRPLEFVVIEEKETLARTRELPESQSAFSAWGGAGRGRTGR